jgi:hypothetical protein
MAFYFRYKTRRELQETLRAAIQSGQELTPEALERIGGPPAPKDTDLRRGVITSAVGLALVAFSFIHTGMDEDGAAGVRATGVLVLLIGLAFVALWRFGDGGK